MIQRLAIAALAAAVALPLSACLVTAPVKAVGWGVDKVTTSQAEADRKRGAEARKREKFCRKHPDRC
jgi:hypothetical protein